MRNGEALPDQGIFLETAGAVQPPPLCGLLRRGPVPLCRLRDWNALSGRVGARIGKTVACPQTGTGVTCMLQEAQPGCCHFTSAWVRNSGSSRAPVSASIKRGGAVPERPASLPGRRQCSEFAFTSLCECLGYVTTATGLFSGWNNSNGIPLFRVFFHR